MTLVCNPALATQRLIEVAAPVTPRIDGRTALQASSALRVLDSTQIESFSEMGTMSDEVISALVKYVQTRCLVDEALLEIRILTIDISRRARELDAEWKRSGPHSAVQIRAMELIPKVKSMLARAQEIQAPLNERQSREIERVRSLSQLLQGESHPNPIPLLNQLLENDERRLDSDIAAMRELLEEAGRDVDKGEELARETVARHSSKRFWK